MTPAPHGCSSDISAVYEVLEKVSVDELNDHHVV